MCDRRSAFRQDADISNQPSAFSIQKSAIREKISHISEQIRPYEDVIIFMVTLLVTNYFWKFTVTGDEAGDRVTWFGIGITAPFVFMAEHTAYVVYELVSLFRDTVGLYNHTAIRYESGAGVSIVWGCTALKQSFIWLCLMLTTPATSKELRRETNLQKLWFIPLGWVCCYLFNIFRIFVIALLMEHHPGWFPMLHMGFKYLFYGMLFMLWVWFVERIRPAAPPATEE